MSARVLCSTVEDFIANLRAGAEIFENTIWACVVRSPLDGTKRDAAKFEVVIQASAVVQQAETEYLVDFGEQCGRDYEDASQDKAGTARAHEILELIHQYAKERGLRVLPGVLDIA